MEYSVRNAIKKQKQKTVVLPNLEKDIKNKIGNNAGPLMYKKLADEVLKMVDEGALEPIKSSKMYLRDTRVKEKYRKVKRAVFDEESLKKDLLTNYNTNMSMSYYLKNLKEFQKVKNEVKNVSNFLNSAKESKPYLSLNERSFEMFGYETAPQ